MSHIPTGSAQCVLCGDPIVVTRTRGGATVRLDPMVPVYSVRRAAGGRLQSKLFTIGWGRPSRKAMALHESVCPGANNADS